MPGTVAGEMANDGPSRIELSAAQIRAFLASPTGVLFRRYLAAGVIITAPLLFRIPALRRHPLIRWLELIGGAALGQASGRSGDQELRFMGASKCSLDFGWRGFSADSMASLTVTFNGQPLLAG